MNIKEACVRAQGERIMSQCDAVRSKFFVCLIKEKWLFRKLLSGKEGVF